MELKEYFENTEGTGVLATADKDGRVDAAIYSRPHILDDGSAAFVMRDRRQGIAADRSRRMRSAACL
ncbi:MAG: pyridoxamine 5'-phosphate oxidase family protein, partial [Deltaproteobacteria bacterium]|nr:pyridoxamine 5'-phosphate oxidase family protein [Deltaproteobacteria bacterium]